MKSDVREYRLPASFFMKNREKLAACLPDRFVAVLFAGNAVCMSGDSDYPFFANRNFYYFAGIGRCYNHISQGFYSSSRVHI